MSLCATYSVSMRNRVVIAPQQHSPLPQKVLSNKRSVESKMLDFSDCTRTGVSIWTHVLAYVSLQGF